MQSPTVALGDIAAWLMVEAGAELVGNPEMVIDGIAPLDNATASDISFLSNPRYASQLSTTAAGCVIVSGAFKDPAVARGAAIIAPDPYFAYARLSQWWAVRTRPAREHGVHRSAVVDATAIVDPTATVGPLAVIEAGATVGPRAFIGPHCVIGAGARVGADTRMTSHVHFGYGCSIGERGLLHPGVVIGADGFGFAPHQGRYEKIEQLGNVSIGNDVEIGANTCIDRGALADTVLEDGVKIDNLVQIAHNVHLGKHVAMAGCSAVAGSTTIGAHSTVGGAGNVAGHLVLAERVNVSGGTSITRSIHKAGTYSGVFPFDDNASWEKNAATLRQLHSLRDRIRELEKKNTP